jgi:DNA-binding transcriptional regulator YhcF (GntR family)
MGERTEHARNVFAWLNQIKRDREVPAGGFKVAFEIAQHISHISGQGFPGMDRVAENIGFAESTVRKAVDQLEALGHLDIERGRGRGNSHRYRMIIKPHVDAVLEAVKPHVDAVLEGAQNRTQRVHKTAPGENKTAPGGQENRTQPAANNLITTKGTTEEENKGALRAPMRALSCDPPKGNGSAEIALRYATLSDLWDARDRGEITQSEAFAGESKIYEAKRRKEAAEEAEWRKSRPCISRATSRPADDWPADFKERFWDAYPQKVAQRAALAALARLRRKRGRPRWDELMDGIERSARHARLNGLQMPNPENWLKGERWNDRPAH